MLNSPIFRTCIVALIVFYFRAPIFMPIFCAVVFCDSSV